MRIVCPSCSAAYDVPDRLLNGREAVRCARCAREWRPTGIVAPAAPAERRPPGITAPPRPVIGENRAAERLGSTFEGMPGAIPEDTAGNGLAIDRLMAPQMQLGASLALRIAWLSSIVLVLVALGAAYVWRAEVMAAWPPSARVYVALGLAGQAR
jgi:predicted Zn finger-like uncharacterized protein